jgi:hypothetical protein
LCASKLLLEFALVSSGFCPVVGTRCPIYVSGFPDGAMATSYMFPSFCFGSVIRNNEKG